MKYIVLCITAVCSLYPIFSYAMHNESDTAPQRQRSVSVPKHEETPDEMMARFIRVTSPAKLQRLREIAKAALEDEERRNRERIKQNVDRVLAH